MTKDDAKTRLLTAAAQLFARRGYDGTSVRAIAQRAKVNLGAITYHFGSKHALYEAVLEAASEPLRTRVAAIGAEEGHPLDRIERVLHAFFDHFHEHPELPQLMLQQLGRHEPLPKPARATAESNHRTIAGLIAEGQALGAIRPGNPRLMALSVGSQPVILTLMRRALTEVVGVDQDDPEIRAILVESVVAFIRAGLAAT
jgi:AcrR family transcriptional regulator